MYLFKDLKRQGFQQDILINAYRSLCLSVISYGAPLICACTKSTLHEIQQVQKKSFRIIGISAESALRKYGIPDIALFIEKVCKTKLSRILKDTNHPIISKLRQTQARSRGFKFVVPRAKSTACQKSFLISTLTKLRDEAATKRTTYDEYAIT